MRWILLALLATPACVDLSSPTDHGDAGPTYRVDCTGANSSLLAFHGWDGGSPEFTLPCNTGEVMVGAAGTVESQPDELTVNCAALHTDGTVGPDQLEGSIGPGHGTPFSQRCPTDTIAVGLVGNVDSGGGLSSPLIGSIGLRCAPLAPYLASQSGIVDLPVEGAGTMAPFSELCMPGSVLTGFFGRAGGAFDELRGVCCTVQTH